MSRNIPKPFSPRRKQAVASALEKKYQTLVEMTGTGYVIIDLKGRVLDANPEYVRLTGHKVLAEILGHKVVEWTAAHDRERNAAAVKECVAKGRVRGLEIDYVNLAGGITPVEINATRVGCGRTNHILTLCRDITARKQAEAALRASEERYRLLAECSADMISRHRPDGTVLFVSPACASLLGYTPAELLGKKGDAFVHPADREALWRLITEQTAKGDFYRSEHRMRRKNGDFIWVETSGRLLKNPGTGELKEIICVVRDTTQTKAAAEQLRASHEQLRALAARLQEVREEERGRVAREIHDALAQDLTRLKIDLVWLRRHSPHPGAGSQWPPLQDKLAELLKLTDNAISAVQKIATELRPVVLDSLGLPAAIEWQVEEFQKRTGLHCQITLPTEEIPLERESATAFFRILQESLTNVARHAGATAVEVSFTVEPLPNPPAAPADNRGAKPPCGKELVLIVRDNGCGIKVSEVENPCSLGLVGMRERVLLLGGRFEVSGQAGCGTIVRACMPMAEP